MKQKDWRISFIDSLAYDDQINLVPLKLIDGNNQEIWVGNDISTSFSEDSQLLAKGSPFSHIRILQPINNSESFSHLTKNAYLKLFQLGDKHELGHIVRIWNYIPNILQNIDDEAHKEERERYRLFNIGRAEAWSQLGPHKNGRPIYPAATGIGILSPYLIIDGLFTKHPYSHIENPRQKPAYRYSKRYGAKAPAFSRATLVELPAEKLLLISGTGSIVNSETVHLGSVRDQTIEILSNYQSLTSSTNLKNHGYVSSNQRINNSRIYLRNEQDWPLIKGLLGDMLQNPSVVLKAEFCRPELLIEIEASFTVS